MPKTTRDPSGVLELYRIAVPYPTVMPSYNQIGFDSLHDLVGVVEGTGAHAIGWLDGAIREGMSDIKAVLSHPDFDRIRNSPTFTRRFQ